MMLEENPLFTQRLSEALRVFPVDYKAPLTGSYTVLQSVVSHVCNRWRRPNTAFVVYRFCGGL